MIDKMIKYKCPRCHAKNPIDFGPTIQCTKCHLEFYKKDIGPLKKSNILAISELNDIARILMES